MNRKMSQKESHITLLINIGLADGGIDGAETGIVLQVAGRLGLSNQEVENCFALAQKRTKLNLPDDLYEQILLVLDAFAIAVVTNGIESEEINILTKLCSHLELYEILREVDKLSKNEKALYILHGDYRESLAAKLTEELGDFFAKKQKTFHSRLKRSIFTIN